MSGKPGCSTCGKLGVKTAPAATPKVAPVAAPKAGSVVTPKIAPVVSSVEVPTNTAFPITSRGLDRHPRLRTFVNPVVKQTAVGDDVTQIAPETSVTDVTSQAGSSTDTSVVPTAFPVTRVRTAQAGSTKTVSPQSTSDVIQHHRERIVKQQAVFNAKLVNGQSRTQTGSNSNPAFKTHRLDRLAEFNQAKQILLQRYEEARAKRGATSRPVKTLRQNLPQVPSTSQLVEIQPVETKLEEVKLQKHDVKVESQPEEVKVESQPKETKVEVKPEETKEEVKVESQPEEVKPEETKVESQPEEVKPEETKEEVKVESQPEEVKPEETKEEVKVESQPGEVKEEVKPEETKSEAGELKPEELESQPSEEVKLENATDNRRQRRKARPPRK